MAARTLPIWYKSMLFILLILSLALITFLICPAFQIDAIASGGLNLGTGTLTLIGLGAALGSVSVVMAVYQKSAKNSAWRPVDHTPTISDAAIDA